MSKVEGSPSPPALPTLFCLKKTGPVGSSQLHGERDDREQPGEAHEHARAEGHVEGALEGAVAEPSLPEPPGRLQGLGVLAHVGKGTRGVQVECDAAAHGEAGGGVRVGSNACEFCIQAFLRFGGIGTGDRCPALAAPVLGDLHHMQCASLKRNRKIALFCSDSAPLPCRSTVRAIQFFNQTCHHICACICVSNTVLLTQLAFAVLCACRSLPSAFRQQRTAPALLSPRPLA